MSDPRFKKSEMWQYLGPKQAQFITIHSWDIHIKTVQSTGCLSSIVGFVVPLDLLIVLPYVVNNRPISYKLELYLPKQMLFMVKAFLIRLY